MAITPKAQRLLALLAELEKAGYLQPITKQPQELTLLELAKHKADEIDRRKHAADDLIEQALRRAQQNHSPG